MEHTLLELEREIEIASSRVEALEKRKRNPDGGDGDGDDNGTRAQKASVEAGEGRGSRKRRRRSALFDDLAKHFFSRNEQMMMTSVIGSNGTADNAFCCNGCRSAKHGTRKLGQRNMVIFNTDSNARISLGKWCYKCITKSCDSTKRTSADADGRGAGAYMCTAESCTQEGVGAYIDASGAIVPCSYTCGCREIQSLRCMV